MRNRLLIVENDGTCTAAAYAVFSEDEWEVEPYGTAELALEEIRKAMPSAIVCKDDLVGLTGRDFAERVREIPGSGDVRIFLAGEGLTEDKVRGLSAIDGALSYPFEPTELRDLILGRTAYAGGSAILSAEFDQAFEDLFVVEEPAPGLVISDAEEILAKPAPAGPAFTPAPAAAPPAVNLEEAVRELDSDEEFGPGGSLDAFDFGAPENAPSEVAEAPVVVEPIEEVLPEGLQPEATGETVEPETAETPVFALEGEEPLEPEDATSGLSYSEILGVEELSMEATSFSKEQTPGEDVFELEGQPETLDLASETSAEVAEGVGEAIGTKFTEEETGAIEVLDLGTEHEIPLGDAETTSLEGLEVLDLSEEAGEELEVLDLASEGGLEDVEEAEETVAFAEPAPELTAEPVEMAAEAVEPISEPATFEPEPLPELSALAESAVSEEPFAPAPELAEGSFAPATEPEEEGFGSFLEPTSMATEQDEGTFLRSTDFLDTGTQEETAPPVETVFLDFASTSVPAEPFGQKPAQEEPEESFLLSPAEAAILVEPVATPLPSVAEEAFNFESIEEEEVLPSFATEEPSPIQAADDAFDFGSIEEEALPSFATEEPAPIQAATDAFDFGSVEEEVLPAFATEEPAPVQAADAFDFGSVEEEVLPSFATEEPAPVQAADAFDFSSEEEEVLPAFATEEPAPFQAATDAFDFGSIEEEVLPAFAAATPTVIQAATNAFDFDSVEEGIMPAFAAGEPRGEEIDARVREATREIVERTLSASLDPEQLRGMIREQIEKVIWEVVPPMAERLLQEAIQKLQMPADLR